MGETACWNCRHANSGDQFMSTGAECSLCRCPVPGFPWHLYRRYARFEQVMPQLCGHYEAQDAGPCPACNSPLGPLHLVQHWACGVFTVVACCSSTCGEVIQSRLDAEEDAITQPNASRREPCGDKVH